MPLIVPNVGGSAENDWMNKLMGKTLTDGAHSETAFSKRDLPKDAQVLQYGAAASAEHVPDRLNVFLDKDGTVARVTVG